MFFSNRLNPHTTTALGALAITSLLLVTAGIARAGDPNTGDDLPPGLVSRLRLANMLYDQDNLSAALVEYRRIQVESGKAPGLFNVARICARLNRPVEAVAEFDKLLASPGQTPADKLEEARRLRNEQAARIGQLIFWTSVPAFIEIDNVAVGKADVKVHVGARQEADGTLVPDMKYATAKPIELGNGSHLVAALAPGHAPLRQQIEIGGGTTKEILLALVPAKGELAHIRVKTPVPGADILLDGALVGRTPIDVSLSVESGLHDLSLKRAGYRTATLQRSLREGQTWDAEIAMEEDPAESSWQSGVLILDGYEPGSALSVNGKIHDLRNGEVKLPVGPHELEITHSGFLPYRTQVDMEKGITRRMHVQMEATAESRHERLARVSGQRWRAWGTVAVGALITGGGAFYLRSARSDRDQANRDYNEVQAQFQAGGECSPLKARDEEVCQAKVDRVNQGIATADNKVLGGYIATGVGAAILVTGVVLVLTTDDTSRFEKRDGQVAWLGWATPHGGGLTLAGRF